MQTGAATKAHRFIFSTPARPANAARYAARVSEDLSAAQRGDEGAFRRLVAPFSRELRAHCYRMSGSLHDAEDLLQESLLRAWKGLAGFEGRASLRTWLHRVTTSVCLDRLEARGPRLLPMDLAPANGPMSAPQLDPIWLEPCPAALYDEPIVSSPEARVSARESVGLAFLVALQRLPPRQRAALLMRDVLGFEASECAELLDATVASINSALQRARETLSSTSTPRPTIDDATRTLLGRYVRAWEEADVGALVALLREDATLAMPPLPAWVSGAHEIGASIGAMVFVPGSRGAFRLVPTEANGLPALAAYKRGDDGAFAPYALHVLDVRGDRIAAMTAFLDASLFPLFALPAAP
jgi:RNA polymerase sigma-70 factor (ECF subfamily)